MLLKDQLAADMENVFMNPDELADSVTIDGVATAGFLLEHSGEYEELVQILKVASTTSVSSDSVILIGSKTYGVNGEPLDDGFGSKTIILGERL
jgi:hypothetical protein